MSKQHHNTPVYAGQRVVGRVNGETFHKVIKGSIHFLRKPAAIAFDVSALEQAQQAGAVYVQVMDRETGTVYKATIDHIRSEGLALNRGYGPQIALPLEGWMKTRPGRLMPEQLSLFSQVTG